MPEIEDQAADVVIRYSKEQAGHAWQQVEYVRLGIVARTWVNVLCAVDNWRSWVFWATPDPKLQEEFLIDAVPDQTGEPKLIFGSRVDPRK